MALFPTASTMVSCLNFLLSWISDHYRLAYPTVAIVKEIGQKMALFPTSLGQKSSPRYFFNIKQFDAVVDLWGDKVIQLLKVADD